MTPGGSKDRRRLGNESGSSDALGLALLAPAAIGLALVILLLGRGVDGRATVRIAAETGAQAAAQERTPTAAAAVGRDAAMAMLVDPLTCAAPTVAVDVSQFRPGGVVTVVVTCTVSTAGLELIDPGGETFSAQALATIDPLRAAEGG